MRVLTPRARIAVAALAMLQALAVLVALGGRRLPVLGGDGPEYLAEASNLLHRGVLSAATTAPYEPSVIRAPGYPAFLGLLDLAGLGGPAGVRLAQLLLLALIALAAGRLAAHFLGPRAGAVAAVLCVTNLPLTWLALSHLSETAATLATVLAIGALVHARAWAAKAGAPARSASVRFALAGTAFGAAAWIRPSSLVLAAVVAVAIVLTSGPGGVRSGARWRHGIAFALAVAVTVTPWAVRTSLLVDRPVAMVTGSGGSMWLSAQQWRGEISPSMSPADWAAYDVQARSAARGIVPVGRRAVSASPAAVVAADRAFASAAPWSQVTAAGVATHAPGRLAALWGPMGQAPAGLRGADLLTRLTIIQHLLLAGLALAGLWCSRRRLAHQWPLWLPAATLTAQHLVFHSEPRYTAEARPMLLAYAAAGVLALAAHRSRSRAAVGRGAGAGQRSRVSLPHA